MTTVLVTGSCGYIGSAVTARLVQDGDLVVALDLRRSGWFDRLTGDHPNIRFEACDTTEWPSLIEVFERHRPSAVVHCAAAAGPTTRPIVSMRVNVEGSLNVLAAMRLTGGRRFINISSEEVYGPFGPGPVDETHPCWPATPQAVSKFAFEQLARHYTAEHDLTAVSVRTAWNYGPLLPRSRPPQTIIAAAVGGIPLHLPQGGDFRVDHVFIDDLCRGIRLLLDHPAPPHDIYNIATGEAPSLAEIAQIVREIVPGADISIGPGPYVMKGVMTPVRKAGLDSGRALRDLGFRAAYDIRRGLQACIDAQRIAFAIT